MAFDSFFYLTTLFRDNERIGFGYFQWPWPRSSGLGWFDFVFTGFYWVFLGWDRCNWVLPSFTGFFLGCYLLCLIGPLMKGYRWASGSRRRPGDDVDVDVDGDGALHLFFER